MRSEVYGSVFCVCLCMETTTAALKIKRSVSKSFYRPIIDNEVPINKQHTCLLVMNTFDDKQHMNRHYTDAFYRFTYMQQACKQ